MESQELEAYLAELGTDLKAQGLKKPIRVLMIGGAYMMLLANAPRTTEDIDIFWLEEGEAFQQNLYALRDSVQAVAERHALGPGWFNYLTQMLIYDKIIVPKSKLWQRFGPLHIYTPPKEYILALKILAGRDKDIEDCLVLLPQTKIKTRQQAQELLDRYILPAGQRDNAEQIEYALNELFGKTDILANRE